MAGLTVNRLCGSGLQAINSAAHAIAVGDGDVFVAGGVESMSRAPFVMLKPEAAFERGTRELVDSTLGWRFVNPKLDAAHPAISLGETAECVADDWHVTRERQDAFAAESQRRAVAAIEGGRFDGQLVPVPIPQRKGDPVLVARDEHPRADTTLEGLARLRPAFRDGRDRHRRQRVGDQRRRRRGPRRGGRARPRAGPAADGAGRRHRRRRRGPAR